MAVLVRLASAPVGDRSGAVLPLVAAARVRPAVADVIVATLASDVALNHSLLGGVVDRHELHARAGAGRRRRIPLLPGVAHRIQALIVRVQGASRVRLDRLHCGRRDVELVDRNIGRRCGWGTVKDRQLQGAGHGRLGLDPDGSVHTGCERVDLILRCQGRPAATDRIAVVVRGRHGQRGATRGGLHGGDRISEVQRDARALMRVGARIGAGALPRWDRIQGDHRIEQGALVGLHPTRVAVLYAQLEFRGFGQGEPEHHVFGAVLRVATDARDGVGELGGSIGTGRSTDVAHLVGGVGHLAEVLDRLVGHLPEVGHRRSVRLVCLRRLVVMQGDHRVEGAALGVDPYPSGRVQLEAVNRVRRVRMGPTLGEALVVVRIDAHRIGCAQHGEVVPIQVAPVAQAGSRIEGVIRREVDARGWVRRQVRRGAFVQGQDRPEAALTAVERDMCRQGGTEGEHHLVGVAIGAAPADPTQ